VALNAFLNADKSPPGPIFQIIAAVERQQKEQAIYSNGAGGGKGRKFASDINIFYISFFKLLFFLRWERFVSPTPPPTVV
jgi:hypothetical protein